MRTTPARVPLLAVSILLGLAACSRPEPPPAPHQAPTPESVGAALPPAETVAVPAKAEDLDALIDAANAALAADRMFAPPGDNALELLLRVLEARPEDARGRQGLVDILPFVLIGLEQRLMAGDVAETERLLSLFRRADPAHPALSRLAAQLDSERERQQRVETARVEAEARRAALAAAETAATPVVGRGTAAPVAAPAPVTPRQPDAAAPASAVSPEPASPPTAPSPTPPAPTPAGLPAVLAQVPPRYPPQAQRRRIEGLVEVEFIVRADGSVADARVLRSEPEGVFDREALGAIQRWRFEATGREVVGRRVFDFRLGG